jgi:hypothetical protein
LIILIFGEEYKLFAIASEEESNLEPGFFYAPGQGHFLAMVGPRQNMILPSPNPLYFFKKRPYDLTPIQH